MPYKMNPFTGKMDYYETGTITPASNYAIPNKIVSPNRTGSCQFIFTGSYKIDSIDMRPVSGVPSVRIGTTIGGNDILEDTSLNGNDLNYPIGLSYPAGITYYITITGGNVDIEIDYKDIF